MKMATLQKYDEWLVDNLDEIVNKYAGKVIAIYKDRVIIVGKTETEVYKKIWQRRLKPMPLVFRVPHEQDFQSILLTKSR